MCDSFMASPPPQLRLAMSKSDGVDEVLFAADKPIDSLEVVDADEEASKTLGDRKKGFVFKWGQG